jgi:predicted dehydrogenase
MVKVKCSVIGAGWWATTAHIPALKGHPDAELVAVQNPDRATAERVARDFEVPHACTTMDELLAVDGLQAVVVSSVPQAHYGQAKDALERGLHVLLEKPMTITAREAEELVEIAAAKNLHFLIGAPWHYTPHSIEAQRLIREGAIGDVKMISVLMTNFTLGLYQGLPWEQVFGKNPTLQNAAAPYLKPEQHSYSDPKLAGGGQIYCQVSHAAAYLGFLTGLPPMEVFARFDNAGTSVDVYDTLNIKLQNGAVVSLASTGATMLSDRHYEVRVYGTRGMLLLELWKGKMELHDQECNVKHYSDIPEADIYPMFAPPHNLVDTVSGQAPNGSPATLGAYAMKIVDAACQSARENRNIIL